MLATRPSVQQAALPCRTRHGNSQGAPYHTAELLWEECRTHPAVACLQRQLPSIGASTTGHVHPYVGCSPEHVHVTDVMHMGTPSLQIVPAGSPELDRKVGTSPQQLSRQPLALHHLPQAHQGQRVASLVRYAPQSVPSLAHSCFSILLPTNAPRRRDCPTISLLSCVLLFSLHNKHTTCSRWHSDNLEGFGVWWRRHDQLLASGRHQSGPSGEQCCHPCVVPTLC